MMGRVGAAIPKCDQIVLGQECRVIKNIFCNLNQQADLAPYAVD